MSDAFLVLKVDELFIKRLDNASTRYYNDLKLNKPVKTMTETVHPFGKSQRAAQAEKRYE